MTNDTYIQLVTALALRGHPNCNVTPEAVEAGQWAAKITHPEGVTAYVAVTSEPRDALTLDDVADDASAYLRRELARVRKETRAATIKDFALGDELGGGRVTGLDSRAPSITVGSKTYPLSTIRFVDGEPSIAV